MHNQNKQLADEILCRGVLGGGGWAYKYKGIKKLHTHNVMIYVYILCIYIYTYTSLVVCMIWKYKHNTQNWNATGPFPRVGVTLVHTTCSSFQFHVGQTFETEKHDLPMHFFALKLSVKWPMTAYIFRSAELVANFDNTRGQGRSNVTRCTASICVTPTCGCKWRTEFIFWPKKKSQSDFAKWNKDATRRQTSCPPSLKAVKALVFSRKHKWPIWLLKSTLLHPRNPFIVAYLKGSALQVCSHMHRISTTSRIPPCSYRACNENNVAKCFSHVWKNVTNQVARSGSCQKKMLTF